MSHPPEPQVRLKGNLFARPDYFTTDVAKGATRTPNGTRICALTSDFLLGFRDAVVYECGKAFRPVMKSCGRRWGIQLMKRFDKEIMTAYQTPVKDLSAGVVHACLADLFNYHGWGRLVIDLSASERSLILLTLHDSVMPALVPESDRPVDLLMTGLFAAIFTHFAGRELDCVQTDCPSRGANASRFIVAAPSRIAEIEGWLESAPSNEPFNHEAVLRRLLRRPEESDAGSDSPAPRDSAVKAHGEMAVAGNGTGHATGMA
jgi:predicted hydrocarbon binding protein